MGLNNLTTYSASETISDSTVNQYKTALVENMVPRNSTGVPTDIAGSIGDSSYKWLKAFIESGYWNVGDIKPHHSYNGSAPISQGWFPCLGGIINETNYNAIHGAGAWDTYIGSSLLDGKYAPNLVNGYLTGVASTTQDGSTSITNTGNTGNTVNISHNHTVDSHTHTTPNHNHQWYEVSGSTTVTDKTYNTSGTLTSLTEANKISGIGLSTTTSQTSIGIDGFTSNDNGGVTGGSSGGTGDSLSTTQDVRPNSLEVTYYIRII